MSLDDFLLSLQSPNDDETSLFIAPANLHQNEQGPIKLISMQSNPYWNNENLGEIRSHTSMMESSQCYYQCEAVPSRNRSDSSDSVISIPLEPPALQTTLDDYHPPPVEETTFKDDINAAFGRLRWEGSYNEEKAVQNDLNNSFGRLRWGGSGGVGNYWRSSFGSFDTTSSVFDDIGLLLHEYDAKPPAAPDAFHQPPLVPSQCFVPPPSGKSNAVCSPMDPVSAPIMATSQSICQVAANTQKPRPRHPLPPPRRTCSAPGCPNRVVQGGRCISHGARRKKCSHPGCAKNVKKAGLCSAHGPERKRCEFEGGCLKVAVRGGRCIAHGAKKKRCSIEACAKQGIVRGMCKKHHDEFNGAP